MFGRLLVRMDSLWPVNSYNNKHTPNGRCPGDCVELRDAASRRVFGGVGKWRCGRRAVGCALALVALEGLFTLLGPIGTPVLAEACTQTKTHSQTYTPTHTRAQTHARTNNKNIRGRHSAWEAGVSSGFSATLGGCFSVCHHGTVQSERGVTAMHTRDSTTKYTHEKRHCKTGSPLGPPRHIFLKLLYICYMFRSLLPCRDPVQA